MKTVEEAARVEKERRTRVRSLVSELKAERDCIKRFQMDRIDGRAEVREAVVGRQEALDAVRDQLRDKEGTLSQVRAELTIATSKLKTLRFSVETVNEDLSIAQTDVSLQTTLQEKAREQLHAKVAEPEEVQPPLEMKENELKTMHDAQAKVAAELKIVVYADRKEDVRVCRGVFSYKRWRGTPETCESQSWLREQFESAIDCGVLPLTRGA